MGGMGRINHVRAMSGMRRSDHLTGAVMRERSEGIG
jgi:hypothetical protein